MNKSEKWGHARTAVEIPEATRSVKTSQKTVIAADAITFCIISLDRYLLRSVLKIGEI